MFSLILATILFFFVSLYLVRPWLSPRYAVPILGFKFFLIPLYAFARDRYNLPWRGSDRFFRQTNELLQAGYTPLDGLSPIGSAFNTTSSLYWWWNSIWIEIIGNTMFAPRLANVFVMVIASIVATRLVAQLGFGYKYQQLFFVFTLIQWEVLAWSTVANTRDSIIALKILIIFYFIIILSQTEDYKAIFVWLLTIMLTLFLLWHNRRELVPMIFITTFIWYFTETILSNEKLNIPAATAPLFILLAVFLLTINQFGSTISESVVLSHALVGFFRQFIGPVPFGTTSTYSFLNVPAILHWIFVPFAVVGILSLVRDKYVRLILIFTMIVMFAHSFTIETSGPRYRVQVVFFIALFQFQGIWFVMQRHYDIFIKSKPDRPVTAN